LINWGRVILLALLPISELRGSIPVGIAIGLDPIKVLIVSIVINALVYFIVIFVLERVYVSKFNSNKLVNSIINKVRKRANRVKKLGYFGLTVLVAIPAPVTGVWTASILTWILGYEKRKAFGFISIGVVIAGLIVYSIILGVINLWN